MIGLHIDAYGTYARASAAADILEVYCLRTGDVSKEWAADWFHDTGAVDAVLKHHFQEEQAPVPHSIAPLGSLGEEADSSLEAAESVFAVLSERAQILGPRYPFLLTSGGLVRRPGEAHSLPYLALLWTAVIHGQQIEGAPTSLPDFFEDFVEAALSSQGLSAAGLQTGRRDGGSFEDAVTEAARWTGVGNARPGTLHKVSAKDAGVDVIARVPWPDLRPSHWVFLVQATCAASDRWEDKMGDASPHLWRDLLGLHCLPRPALAVPHHMNADVLKYLGRLKPEVLLLDRIGLCSLSSCFPVGFQQLLDFAEEINLLEA